MHPVPTRRIPCPTPAVTAQAHARSKLQPRCQRQILEPLVEAGRVAHLRAVNSSPPGSGGFKPRANADTALRFVRTVLISPLWHVRPERLRERPVRERVGAVPAVEGDDAGFERGVLQIGVVVAELRAGHQPLVADEPGRKRADVSRSTRFGEPLAKFEPAEEQPAVGGGRIALDLEEDVLDGRRAAVRWAFSAACPRSWGPRGSRATSHRAAGQHFAHDACADLLFAGRFALEEEDDADGECVFFSMQSCPRPIKAKSFRLFAEKRVRQRCNKSRAIAGLAADPRYVHRLERGDGFTQNFDGEGLPSRAATPPMPQA